MRRGSITRIKFVPNGAPPEEQHGKRDDQGETINAPVGEVEFEIRMIFRAGHKTELRRQNPEFRILRHRNL